MRHTSFYKLPTKLLALSSAILFANQVYADTQVGSGLAQIDSTGIIALPDTVVTAKKIKDADMKNAAEMYDRPYHKQVVTAERIEQENPNDVTDAIRNMAGVTLVESGGLQKRVSIRGLSGRRVGTLIDGIKLSNQGLDFGGGGDINSIDTSNIERIEVVKGSPAVIYDPGTAGGAINVITKKTPQEDGFGVKQTLGLDAGYDKSKSSTELTASMAGWGLRASRSQQKANDFKVKNADKVQLVILSTNDQAELSDTAPIKVSDLGYKTKETSIKLSKALLGDAQVSVDYADWQGDDIAFVYGRTLSSDRASVLRIHEKNRKTWGVNFNKQKLGVLSDLSVRYAKQDQARQETEQSSVQTLDSQSIIASAQYNTGVAWGDLELTGGFEYTQDEALTAVISDQDYVGAFANAVLLRDKWNLYAGIRHNQWKTNQNLIPGANATVASQLVGISGITPEKKVSDPTWSVGAQYQISDNQNISLNYNTTFRNPDLTERYAFGGVVGGGIDMSAESGKHTQLTYKLLDENLSINATVFFSDFENYIHTKQNRQVRNRNALEACNLSETCNPEDNLNDYYRVWYQYYNSPKVKNRGLEVSGKYFQGNHDVSTNISFNKITSDDIFVQTNANPLRLNAAYKYSFNNRRFEPWIKLNAEQTWDTPTIKQTGGYDPYFVADLYAGMQLDDWVKLNVGVRNIFDNNYRPAFSALSGLERSFFGSLTFQWDNFEKAAK